VKSKLDSSFWRAKSMRRLNNGNLPGSEGAMARHFTYARCVNSIFFARRGMRARLSEEIDQARSDFSTAKTLAVTDDRRDSDYFRLYSSSYLSVINGEPEHDAIGNRLKQADAARFVRRCLPMDTCDGERWSHSST
jgi:hypothetical protein